MQKESEVSLLTYKEVCAKVRLSRAWVYRLERAGKFPRRIKLGEQKVAWLRHEIDAWIMKKARQRKRARVRL